MKFHFFQPNNKSWWNPLNSQHKKYEGESARVLAKKELAKVGTCGTKSTRQKKVSHRKNKFRGRKPPTRPPPTGQMANIGFTCSAEVFGHAPLFRGELLSPFFSEIVKCERSSTLKRFSENVGFLCTVRFWSGWL